MPHPKGVVNMKTGSESKIYANRYKVVSRLGSGKCGVVFLVDDLKTESSERKKALKKIPIGDMQPDETIEASHEAQLLRRLDHINVIKFYDSFVEDDNFCIVTEYCEKGDLEMKMSEMKKSKKRLDEDHVLEWFIQLVMGVYYVHSQKVIHRDLKPSNIYIKNNMLKIGDFGISRLLMGTTDMATTFTGTPYYMSPELLKHDGYNSKSDIWSLGCILYKMCTYQNAFDGAGLMGVMYKVVEGKCPHLPDHYSQALQDVLSRLLVKEINDRPSAREVLKLPYIEEHIMKRLKTTMGSEKDATIQNHPVGRKETTGIVKHATKNVPIDDGLSPLEKMRLRKKQEADERARKLSQETVMTARSNAEYVKNRRSREYQGSQALPFSSSRPSDDAQTTSPLHRSAPFATDRLDYEQMRNHTVPPATSMYAARGPGVEDDDYHWYQPPLRGMSTAPLDSLDYAGYSDHRYGTGIHKDGLSVEKFETNGGDDYKDRLTVGSHYQARGDDRPITPMKNQAIYNATLTDVELREEIFSDAKLAETYYSQYENEFEEVEDMEDYTDDETLTGEETSNDLIQFMEQVLSDSASAENTYVVDDTIKGAVGPEEKKEQIMILRKQCIDELGEKVFKKAYKFLSDIRLKPEKNKLSEKEIAHKLVQMGVSKEKDHAYLVENLIFLEGFS